ncbi:MAG: hypothetical protein LDLANPLL_00216 [Turneriella sp.]|nr:hypothetical protein [Turneriella sp.]
MKLNCLYTLLPLFFVLGACSGGFEKFAPPANSITGRGAKVRPKILTSSPAHTATVSPVTDANGTRIVVVFDMTMDTAKSVPNINTYVRDIGAGVGIVWLAVENSGTVFTWSSTNYLNDTLTIQLGWVRWPENNIIGFDFDNNKLVNLDEMPLDNPDKLFFTVGWNPGRYHVVQTGQYYCHRFDTVDNRWEEEKDCRDSANSGQGIIGSYNYPAGQNGFNEPRNSLYGPANYDSEASGFVKGRRFRKDAHPMNLDTSACHGNESDACYPYSLDAPTTLLWRTCVKGASYDGLSGGGALCTPAAGGEYTWGEAVNACASLNTAANGMGYAGRRDWRLPTMDELENLVDFGAYVSMSNPSLPPEGSPGAPEVPALDTFQETSWPTVWEGAFPNTPFADGYWTATGISALMAGQTVYSQAYTVDFTKGATGPGPGTATKTNTSRVTTNRKKVRCVAGPLVAPQTQTLNPTTVAAGATLGRNGATFVGFDNDTTFNIKSVTPEYNIDADESSLVVEYNKLPNIADASNLTNYCIEAQNATSCGSSSPAITTVVQVTGKPSAFKLRLTTNPASNGAYKLFVTNVYSYSNEWQTGVSYTAGVFVVDPGTGPGTEIVYRTVNAHTSTTIANDLLNGDLEQLSVWTPGTTYTLLNQWLYIPSKSAVGRVEYVPYTASPIIDNDIGGGYFGTPTATITTIVVTPKQSLSVARGLFTGIARRSSPSATVAFNVDSIASPNLNTINLTFDRLPKANEASNAANYCIISANASPWNFCTSPLAAVSTAVLSGKTVTLTPSAPLVAGTPYAVLVNGVTYAGSNVVDDPINKLRWQRCRYGVFDTPTCDDDGVTANDSVQWNEGLNYCDSLNATRYDDDNDTARALNDYTRPRYAWRAPTINELRSIANRSLFATQGINIDITIFPTPNAVDEEYFSSTNYAMSGSTTGSNLPANNQIWTFNYVGGYLGTAQKDNSTLTGIFKPLKRNIRCVRGLP